MHHIGGRAARDPTLWCGTGFHSLIVLDLGDRGAQNIAHLDWSGPIMTRPGTGEHQQIGAIAPHARGQVIEPEQVTEPLGILLLEFERLDHAELAIHQRLVAPRHGLEHGVDLIAQQLLLCGEFEGLGVQTVHRAGDFADLLTGVHRHRFHLDVLELGAAHDPLDLAREVLLGEFAGTRPQPA